MNIPEWVVTEVGRLHLHALALEKELEKLQSVEDKTSVDTDAGSAE